MEKLVIIALQLKKKGNRMEKAKYQVHNRKMNKVKGRHQIEGTPKILSKKGGGTNGGSNNQEERKPSRVRDRIGRRK